MAIQTSSFSTAEVTANHAWTDRLYSLRVCTEQLPFKPGQFVRLQLEIAGERVAKPYSLVNAPGEAEMEFYYNTIPEGRLSKALAALKPGDRIEVSQPASGFFVLDEVPKCKHLWLVATGTGLGPYLSMLRTDEIWERFARVFLVHGVPLAEELVYHELIDSCSRYGSQFTFIPCVSRERYPRGLHGRVTELLASGALERFAGCEITRELSHLMLCGNHGMIDDMKALLAKRGMTKHLRHKPGHITTEQYF